MMDLQTGEDKIQKICDALRKETIEPAQEEAQNIIDRAKEEAEKLIRTAKEEAENILAQARSQSAQEKNVFQSSLNQATKQSLESLRQTIENQLFNPELQQMIDKPMADPKIVADLVNSIVKAIEKEGLQTDIAAVVPKSVNIQDLNKLLIENVFKKLKDKPLEVGNFVGGAQVKLLGKKITLDMSDKALKDLLAQYLRKDFRQMLYNI